MFNLKFNFSMNSQNLLFLDWRQAIPPQIAAWLREISNYSKEEIWQAAECEKSRYRKKILNKTKEDFCPIKKVTGIRWPQYPDKRIINLWRPMTIPSSCFSEENSAPQALETESGILAYFQVETPHFQGVQIWQENPEGIFFFLRGSFVVQIPQKDGTVLHVKRPVIGIDDRFFENPEHLFEDRLNLIEKIFRITNKSQIFDNLIESELIVQEFLQNNLEGIKSFEKSLNLSFREIIRSDKTTFSSLCEAILKVEELNKRTEDEDMKKYFQSIATQMRWELFPNEIQPYNFFDILSLNSEEVIIEKNRGLEFAHNKNESKEFIQELLERCQMQAVAV